jgi:hypothetical protein
MCKLSAKSRTKSRQCKCTFAINRKFDEMKIWPLLVLRKIETLNVVNSAKVFCL